MLVQVFHSLENVQSYASLKTYEHLRIRSTSTRDAPNTCNEPNYITHSSSKSATPIAIMASRGKVTLQDEGDDYQRPEWYEFAPNYDKGGDVPEHYITRFGRTWFKRLEELRAYKAQHGDCLVPEYYEENKSLGNWVMNTRTQYDYWVADEKSTLTEERIAALEAEGFCWGLYEAPQKEWSERYDQLVAYKVKYGNCDVPQNFVDNPSLGTWVHKQRRDYNAFRNGRKNSMTKERVDALETIGICWSPKETLWQQRLDELVRYRAQYGHCNVPAGFVDNQQLATWVSLQRRQYRNLQDGKPSFLTEERIQSLEQLSFCWTPLEALWQQRCDELFMYKSMYGNCNVPTTFPDNPQLASWVANQRKHYKTLQTGKKSLMTKERAQQLEALGFCWNRLDALWKQRFDELIAYKTCRGDCNVPHYFPENPQLSTWVRHQRRYYNMYQKGKSSSLTDPRIEALDSIGFVWSLRASSKPDI